MADRAAPREGCPEDLLPLFRNAVVPLALFSSSLIVGGRQLRPVDLERQLVELAGERERHLVVLVVHRVPVSEPMSKVSSHCRMSGRVCSIFWVATSLPSTLSTPVPLRPMPLMLLKASVARPEAVVLEVELQRVLAGRERLGAFPADALQVDQVPEEDRLALEQVEAVAAEPAAWVTSMPSAPPCGTSTSAVMV